MTDQSSPEKSPWGWKALIISIILGCIFLVIFYVAVSNEPDYMPSQQNKETSQHSAFKNSPTMSSETTNTTPKVNESDLSANEHGMTEAEHENMHGTNTSHSHN